MQGSDFSNTNICLIFLKTLLTKREGFLLNLPFIWLGTKLDNFIFLYKTVGIFPYRCYFVIEMLTSTEMDR